MLRVSVNAAPCAAQIKGVPEEWRARGLFEIERWPSEEDAIAIRSGKGEHKDVSRLDALFLHTGGRYVDLISSQDQEIAAKKRSAKLKRAFGHGIGRVVVVGSKVAGNTHLTRMLMPPPVPVTQPR